ncbi:MAG TPA: hypothetical protein VEH00_14700, partial [Steroidobacteraceae bacterium]|nr:hypothetical protein [Steroidobacteraceae bacterium]
MRNLSILLASLCLGWALGEAQPQQPASAAPGPTNGAASPAAEGQGPTEVVQEAAQNMLNALDQDRDAYRRDPEKVGELVNKYLLPH